MRALFLMILVLLATAGLFLFVNNSGASMPNGDDLMNTKPENHPMTVAPGFWEVTLGTGNECQEVLSASMEVQSVLTIQQNRQ